MKKGEEYEHFVYNIFSEFYRDFVLIHNDKILGNESKRLRQIDVSIRGQIDGVDLLYLVQAKDYKRPADINVIGAFSAVIKDVGASKGFLICASGFTKTIHQYAKKLGIELLSVEDIESRKWKAEIQIPIIYIKLSTSYIVDCVIIPTPEFIEKNKNTLPQSIEDLRYFSSDNGITYFDIHEYARKEVIAKKLNLSDLIVINLNAPNLILRLSEINVPVSDLSIRLEPKRQYYLKYLTPNEYRGIKNHVNNTFTPTTMKINNVSLILDESYILIETNNIPVTTSFSLEIEEHPILIGDVKSQKIQILNMSHATEDTDIAYVLDG